MNMDFQNIKSKSEYDHSENLILEMTHPTENLFFLFEIFILTVIINNFFYIFVQLK